MTDKTATNLLATITDIHREASERYGYSPQRVFISTVMKNRIIQELADALKSEFVPLRQKARDGMKLLGMRFIVDHKVPDDEMHFCTKRRELMVRVKVDQQPMSEPQSAEHTRLEAAADISAHPSSADSAGASSAAVL